MYAASKYGTLSVADVQTQLSELSPSYISSDLLFSLDFPSKRLLSGVVGLIDSGNTSIFKYIQCMDASPSKLHILSSLWQYSSFIVAYSQF